MDPLTPNPHVKLNLGKAFSILYDKAPVAYMSPTLVIAAKLCIMGWPKGRLKDLSEIFPCVPDPTWCQIHNDMRNLEREQVAAKVIAQWEELVQAINKIGA